MHLMCLLDESGKRIYTLRKVVDGQVTKSAHPARFSPDDKWSRHRVTLRKRFGLLMTEKSGQSPWSPFRASLTLLAWVENLRAEGTQG